MKTILSLIISGILIVSGYSQTRNVLVGTNNTVVQPTNFWSADASNARTGLGLGSAATNDSSAFQPSSAVLSNLASSNAVNLTNIRATNIVGIIPTSSISSINLTNVIGVLALSNGGTGTTNAASIRTNIGLGWSALTNTNDSSSLIGFNTNRQIVANIGTNELIVTNGLQINGGVLQIYYSSNEFRIYDAGEDANVIKITGDQGSVQLDLDSYWSSDSNRAILGFSTNLSSFWTATNASNARTAIGLGWPALTNSNAGTDLVSVNTNGEVVSPTNFWQAAPINTVLQNITNVVGNSTNAATNARMLFLYSLAPTVTNVTSTITLPTNGSTFGGDVSTITHLGPTSSVTAIRALGAGTNIITLNQPEESVRLIYRDSGWTLMDNISYIEPIFFSGTNAAANAAASRTNLGLGWPALTNTNSSVGLVGFTTNGNIVIANTNTNAITITNPIILATGSVYSPIAATIGTSGSFEIRTGTNTNTWGVSYDGNNYFSAFRYNGSQLIRLTSTNINYSVPIIFATNTASAETRTNLGIPLAALTNTDVTNFRTAIELGATNNVTFSNVVASGTLTATSTVTAKTNLVVEGFVDFTTNATNSNPATNNQIQDFIEIRVGTNQFWLPVYQ